MYIQIVAQHQTNTKNNNNK